MTDTSTIKENLERVRERIHAAALRAGRKPQEILLIGVSKTHPAEAVREAFAAGLRHFGENRVQEWEGKLPALADLQGNWHLIGHLQSNKAARSGEGVSFHRFRGRRGAGRAAEPRAGEKSVQEKLRVLVEVHLGGEESKSGTNEAELPKIAELILRCEHLQFAGLMCIPPYRENPDEVRPFFARLRALKEQLESRLSVHLPVLSMGMSHDFEAAIQEGSTEIRVGTAIFGTRPKPA